MLARGRARVHAVSHCAARYFPANFPSKRLQTGGSRELDGGGRRNHQLS